MEAFDYVKYIEGHIVLSLQHVHQVLWWFKHETAREKKKKSTSTEYDWQKITFGVKSLQKSLQINPRKV